MLGSEELQVVVLLENEERRGQARMIGFRTERAVHGGHVGDQRVAVTRVQFVQQRVVARDLRVFRDIV